MEIDWGLIITVFAIALPLIMGIITGNNVKKTKLILMKFLLMIGLLKKVRTEGKIDEYKN